MVLEPDFPLPDGYLWQYDLIRWIQSFATPTLDKVMGYLSLSGVEAFYLIVLPILFWSVNKKVGLRIAYAFLLSMYTNAWLKEAVAVVRPVGVPGIRSLYMNTATSVYSMPSGHAQGTMTFWILVCKWLQRKWLWPLAFLLVFAIGVSRLYLGLHWPVDPLVGWGLGLLFGFLGWGLGRWWTYRRYGFQIRMAFAIGLPLILLIIHNSSTSAEFAALLLSIGAGAVLEGKYFNFDINPTLWKRICSSIIGIAGVIAIQWLLKWSVEDTVWLVVRDLLVGFWATMGTPWVLYKCGLYQRGEPLA